METLFHPKVIKLLAQLHQAALENASGENAGQVLSIRRQLEREHVDEEVIDAQIKTPGADNPLVPPTSN
jgi:hypothetical protein